MSYIQDPNNSKKQVPNTGQIDILKRVGHSILPPALSMSKRPHEVCNSRRPYVGFCVAY